MKIKLIKMENYRKFLGKKEFLINKKNSFCASNGSGKTTVISALRYVLTGNKPTGDIINKSAESVKVTVVLESVVDGVEYSFSRQEFRDKDKPSKFFINGKCTTQKTLNQKIEEVTGSTIDNISLVLSEELSGMAPKDFAKIVMEYTAKSVPLKDVAKHIPEITKDMENFLNDNLPTDVTVKDIEEAETLTKALRKDLKSEIEVIKTKIASKPVVAPAVNIEDIENKLNEIVDKKAKIRAFKIEENNFKIAKENYEKWEVAMKKLEAELGTPLSRPNEKKRDELLDEYNRIAEEIERDKKSINSLKNSNIQLQKTLDALESSVCPISPLITCHENKTVAKEEIADSIEANKECIEELSKNLSKNDEALKTNAEKVEAFKAEVNAYNNYISRKKQYNSMKEAEPKIPPIPKTAGIDEKGLEEEEMLLQSNKREYEAFNEKLELEKTLEKSLALLANYESLVKALADKGPAKQYILKCYTDILENACNQCVENIRPDVHFRFLAENGLQVLMDAGSGVELPVENLSGGERALFLYTMMDLISQLSGVGIMAIDELSVMDEENLSALLEIIEENEDKFSHFFVSAVNYPQISKIFEDKGFSNLV